MEQYAQPQKDNCVEISNDEGEYFRYYIFNEKRNEVSTLAIGFAALDKENKIIQMGKIRRHPIHATYGVEFDEPCEFGVIVYKEGYTPIKMNLINDDLLQRRDKSSLLATTCFSNQQEYSFLSNYNNDVKFSLYVDKKKKIFQAPIAINGLSNEWEINPIFELDFYNIENFIDQIDLVKIRMPKIGKILEEKVIITTTYNLFHYDNPHKKRITINNQEKFSCTPSKSIYFYFTSKNDFCSLRFGPQKSRSGLFGQESRGLFGQESRDEKNVRYAREGFHYNKEKNYYEFTGVYGSLFGTMKKKTPEIIFDGITSSTNTTTKSMQPSSSLEKSSSAPISRSQSMHCTIDIDDNTQPIDNFTFGTTGGGGLFDKRTTGGLFDKRTTKFVQPFTFGKM